MFSSSLAFRAGEVCFSEVLGLRGDGDWAHSVVAEESSESMDDDADTRFRGSCRVSAGWGYSEGPGTDVGPFSKMGSDELCGGSPCIGCRKTSG